MEHTKSHEPLWTRQESADYYRVTTHTIDVWLRKRLLLGMTIGGAVRIYPPAQQPALAKSDSEQALQPA